MAPVGDAGHRQSATLKSIDYNVAMTFILNNNNNNNRPPSVIRILISKVEKRL